MASYTIISPKTGRTYNVDIDREPTEQDIDSIWSQLDAEAQVEDTGQGRFTSALANVGRGALSVIPGAIGGVGYLAEPVIGPGLKNLGEGIESDIESLLPVNPAYQDEFSQKAAGAIGQAGGMLLTGGIAGTLGKGAAVARGLGAAEAAAAGTQVAGRTLLGSGFLSGSREGGQAAEQYGMEGTSAYTRALLGGAIEGATEKYLFGLGSEMAPIGRVLGLGGEAKGLGGFLARAAGTEAGEEAVAQGAGNVATKVLAPEGVETPGIGSGVGEAAALGGVAGLTFGAATGLLPSKETTKPDTEGETITVESGEMPLPEVLRNLNEKVGAAVSANADVLPATKAVLEGLQGGLTDVGEVEGDVRQGLPIRRSIASPGQEGVTDIGTTEGDVLSLVPKKSPAAPPAEPTDATVGSQPTPRGVGTPTAPAPKTKGEFLASAQTLSRFTELSGQELDEGTVQSAMEKIRRDGYVEPLTFTYDPKTGLGVLSDGNHRLEAAKRLGFTQVPVLMNRQFAKYEGSGKGKATTVAEAGASISEVKNILSSGGTPPAAPPAEPTDATVGSQPTPRGVGSPPVVTDEPQATAPAIQPVSAAETPVATEPEESLQKVQSSEPREELTVLPPSAEIDQPSVIRPVLKRDLIDRKEIARMLDRELAKRLSGMRLFMQGKLESGAPITEAAMENTARLYSEARKRGLMEPEPTIDAYIAEQAKAKKAASPKKDRAATEPETPLPKTEKVVAPKAEPEQGAGMTQRDTSKEEKQRKSFLSDLQFYGTARIGEDQYSIKQASDDTFYLEKTSAGQRSIVASGFPDIETAQKSAGELVQPVSEEATSTGQQAAPTEVSPQERGASVETIASGGGMSVEEARQFLARKSDTGEPLIFGRLFSEIAGMQQNERPRVLRAPDKLKAAKQIAGDIVKFKIPVAQEVVDTYGLTLPEGYVRQGDLYVFAPEAPPTQTKPEDEAKSQAQVKETSRTPSVEGQPSQTRPEVQAQEGAAQRSREGEEGVLTLETAAPGVEPGAATVDKGLVETPAAPAVEASLPQTQQTPVARPSGEPFAAPTEESRAAAPGQLATARSVIDEERKRLGRPPVEGPIMDAISDEAIYAQAKAEYDKDPEVGNRLVDSLNARPRAVDSIQQAILGQELVRRRNALDIASDAYIAEPKNTQLEDNFNKASARYEEAKFAAQYGISDVGRTLRLARVLLNLDFSKAGLITRFRQASGGVDPNAEQLKKIDELSNTILESEKKVEELRATKEENARLQELLDNMVQDMKDQAIREFNSVEKARKEAKAAFKAAPNKVSALDTLEEKIRARRAERKKKVMADPFLLNALADAIDDVMLGAIKIAKGVRNVAKWMSEMKAENPDYTDEQLQEIRKASENFYENEIKPELGAEAPAAEVAEEETLEDEEGEEGKVFVTFDDVTGRDIYRMVKDRVQKGMTEIGEVMKSVTEEIQKQLPDVTERQVRDRFSGYGRPLFPSQEASAKKVRELRTLAQYASKIEDAQKKIAPLRSGRQRDDATDAIRQAQKELYRLMKENGLEMPPGPRSLKAPLDVIKRRLKNRRDDLQRQMTAGKRDVVSTKKVERDAEAKALEEEIRALDEALDALDPPLPPSYQDKVKDRMRAVDKEIVELRRKIKERDVSKQKSDPIITAQLQVKLDERDALKQALEDLRIEIEGEPQLTQEEINERAERVLDRNIKALEVEIEQLKDPNYAPKTEQKAEATPTLFRLRKQQEILREERKKLLEARFGKKVKSESERADIAIAALEKSIDNINQKILTGDLSPTARKGTPLENAKIKNLRAERDSLRSVMSLMRKAKADAARDPVAEQIRRDRKYLQSRIEYYENIQKQIADGTYKPKVKEQRKYDESLGKELQKLEEAKNAVADMLLQEKLKNRSTLRKAFDFVGDLFGVQRVITATADISAIGNQGNFILFSNPKIALKAIPDMLRAMKTPEGEKAVQERIRNMPEYKDGELNRVGLYLSMDAGPNSPLSKMEEQYATRLVNKWPKAFGGGIVRGSERAYKTFLDVIRVASYKSMKETLVKGGWFTPPQEATQERLESLANLVNNATGRGSFKMKKADQLLSQAAPFLNTFIFAPRFGLSRFAMALGLPLWRASPGTRALIAQEYAKYAIGVTVAAMLLSLAQDDEDEPIVPDPRATDFLKTRFGDYRVDLLGGFQQPFVFLTRLLTGETVTSKGKVRALREGDRPLNLFREYPLKLKPNYGSADASSVVGDFLRFKLAPTTASILNSLSGKDPVGNRTDVKSEILKAPIPLVVSQLSESLSAEDPADAALLSALGLTGIRTSYQGKEADKNKTAWEKMVKKVEELTGIR